VFARNLRGKLLAPPLRGRRVLAVDPGFRTGCKLAVLDETGNLLEDGVIYPHTPPQTRRAEARVRLEELVRKHQLQVIAIGNGTACRETEEVVSELIADLDDRRHGRTPTVVAPEPEVVTLPPQAVAPPAPEPEAAPAPTPAPEAAAPVPEAVAPPVPEPEATPAPTPAPEAAAPTPEGGDALPQTETTIAPSADGAVPVAQPAPPPPPPNPLLGLPDAPPEWLTSSSTKAGASVYSASPVGREEFPNFDATLRGTISIGRRCKTHLAS